MQRLEVSGAVRLIYRSLGVKGLSTQLTPTCFGQPYGHLQGCKTQRLDTLVFCYPGSEPSGSVKCGEFLNYLRNSSLLRKESVSCILLVTYEISLINSQVNFTVR